MTPKINLLRSSKEEDDQLFYVAVVEVLEIDYLFSWLLLNTPLIVEMLFGMQIEAGLTPRFFYFNISPPQRLFWNKHKMRVLFLNHGKIAEASKLL